MNTKMKRARPYLLFLTVGTTLQVVIDMWVHTLIGDLPEIMTRPPWILVFFLLFTLCMLACALIYRLNKKWLIWLPMSALAGFSIDAVTVAPPEAFIMGLPNPAILSFFISTSGLARIIVDRAMNEKTPRWAYIVIVLAFLFMHTALIFDLGL